jgi:hypothetical protein
LPLHLAPLLVGALTNAEGAPWTGTQANAVVSLIMVGMLFASIAASFVTPMAVRAIHWAVALTVYVAGVLAAGAWPASAIVWPAWFAVGSACGCLIHFGVLVAANSTNAAAGFAWRISVAMVLAGGVMLFVASGRNEPDYVDITRVLAAAIALLAAGGFLLLMRGGPASAPVGGSPAAFLGPTIASGDGHVMALRGRRGALFSLSMLFLFFALLIGFLNNTPNIAAANGLAFSTFIYAHAGAKMIIAAGIALVFLKPLHNRLTTTALFGVATCIAIAMVGTSVNGVALFLALVAFECGLNTMSPRFTAVLARSLEPDERNHLSAAMLSGIVLGPVLFGFLLDSGQVAIMLFMAMVGALVPLIWQLCANGGKTKRPGSRASKVDPDGPNDSNWRVRTGSTAPG